MIQLTATTRVLTKINATIIAIIAAVFMTFLLTQTVAAQDIGKNLGCGANVQFNVPDEGCSADDGGIDAAERVDQIITQVINILSLVVGVVAVIMIIVGGLKYVTSGGDSGNVSGAKNTILYAIVGLVVVAFSQVIVRFVVERATSSTTTTSTGL